jgi:thiamine kinase-like enzyme
MILHCPYIAFASEPGEIGLLMEDLTDNLFPDVRESIELETEDLIVDKMAEMHALFWQSPEIRNMSWLARPEDFLHFLAPGEHESDRQAPPPDKIGKSMEQGWKIAFQLLPSQISEVLLKPEKAIFEPWKNLPQTLVHGDAKMANMALLPPGKIAMFDWARVGRAPCGIELGWYLSVNSTRLARTKEDFMSKYRTRLEFHLRHPITENIWMKLSELTIVSGAMMMLWNKALGFQTGTQRGKQEWDWWVANLEWVVSGNKF